MTMLTDQRAFNPTKKKSPWTEDDISFRIGNCNVLLIAPHGHPEDDTNTGKLARELADRLDCYAVINEEYQKPASAGLKKSDLSKKAVDLYRWSEAEKYQETKVFIDTITRFKDEILRTGNIVLILHIHGIKNNNMLLVAEKTDSFANRKELLQAVIGYGQRKKDNSRYTASKTKFVDPFIKFLKNYEFNSEIAPVEPIRVKAGEKFEPRWYCGNHSRRLNQYFCMPKSKIQSIQIEFRKKGVREFPAEISATAGKLESALKTFVKPLLDNAVQNAAIQQIKAGDIDLDNEQFKARIDKINSKAAEFKRLVKSVETDGVLNNIIVRELSDQSNGKLYQLISGFRRISALKESKNGANNFETATVMAKILKASVSDDDAYRISFTENLARKDLSLWEIAQACAEIKKKMGEPGKPKGDIDNYIASLIQKDPRTVRRYLKLAAIKNNDITQAVHKGSINYLDALEIGDNDLEEGDITTLLGHLKNHPKPTRAFKQFYENLEYCCDKSKMSLAAVLACKNADEFLSFKRMELEKRVEHLRITTGKEYPDIFKGKAGSLIKDTGEIDAGLIKKKAEEKFKEQNKEIVERVTQAFSKSNITGKFKIKPASVPGDNRVTVTITVPKDQIWQAFDAVSTANNSKAGRVARKKESKTQPSKVVSPASNKVEKPESIIKDASKTVYRGSFEK